MGYKYFVETELKTFLNEFTKYTFDRSIGKLPSRCQSKRSLSAKNIKMTFSQVIYTFWEVMHNLIQFEFSYNLNNKPVRWNNSNSWNLKSSTYIKYEYSGESKYTFFSVRVMLFLHRCYMYDLTSLLSKFNFKLIPWKVAEIATGDKLHLTRREQYVTSLITYCY